MRKNEGRVLREIEHRQLVADRAEQDLLLLLLLAAIWRGPCEQDVAA